MEGALDENRDHDLELNIIYDSLQKPFISYIRGDGIAVAAHGKQELLHNVDVAMLNFLPKIEATQGKSDTDGVKSEFIFIVDQSGSMEGNRIIRAKETLLLLLKSLPVGCYFQIISFGSTFRSLFPV